MSVIYTGTERVDAFFAHHGILGQKWGRRRYQNPDGTLTPEGRKRYGEYGPGKLDRKQLKKEHSEKFHEIEKSKEKLYKQLGDKAEAIRKKHTAVDRNGNEYFDDDYWSGPDSEEELRIEREFINEQRKSEKEAYSYILKKYGTEGLSKVKQQERRNTAAGITAGLAAVGIVVGTPIALIKGTKFGFKKLFGG